MGHKPLTFPAFLIVMLLLAMGIFAILAWGGNISPEVRQFGRVAFFSCLAALPLCFLWHMLLSRSGNDIYPDILAEAFPEASPCQLGDCHLTADVVTGDGGVRFIFCIQNRFDHEVRLDLKIKPWTTWQFPDRFPPPLEVKVAPGGVYIAHLWRGFETIDDDKWLKLHMSGTTLASQRDRKVRFANRPVFDTGTQTWMTVLGALGGGIYVGGKREWKMRWPACIPKSSVPDDVDWNISLLWAPEQNQSAYLIAERVNDIFKLDLAR